MKKLIFAAAAVVMLAACQTTGSGSGYSPDNKPTVVTSKTVLQAKQKAKAIFTGPMQGFSVARETPNLLLFSKSLPANVNDNNPLKDRTKGKPLAQLQLVFTAENGKTRVTADNWMILNPAGQNKDKFNLLATPDGRRLQNKLNEMR